MRNYANFGAIAALAALSTGTGRGDVLVAQRDDPAPIPKHLAMKMFEPSPADVRAMTAAQAKRDRRANRRKTR